MKRKFTAIGIVVTLLLCLPAMAEILRNLTGLTGASVDSANDRLLINDDSANTDKSITVDELRIGLGLGTAASPQFTGIELSHATQNTLTASGGVLSVEGVAVPTISSTSTLTNKRVTKRAPSITQAAAPAINTDVTDVAHITGLAQAITSMTTNLTGTPVEGDTLRIDITDDGTARAITWGASFENGAVALPTTTTISTRLDVLLYWNTVTSKWRCMAAGP